MHIYEKGKILFGKTFEHNELNYNLKGFEQGCPKFFD